MPVREFCDSMGAAGTYMNGGQEVRCMEHEGQMYTFVAKQADTGDVENDMEMVPLQGQPAWALDGSTCNTWLFVNDGQQSIDYARGTNEHWTSDAFDFQKNIWVWNRNGANVNMMNKS